MHRCSKSFPPYVLLVFLFACGQDPAEASQAQASIRVASELVALYEFSEGSGATVLDTSGVAPLLDLTIEDPTAATWTSGGLSIDSPTVISSVGAATKLIDAAQTAEEVTVEAWVTSSDLGQNGPARIVSVSSTSSSRNMTLGQGVYNKGGDRFEVRLRSTATSNNGTPATQTPQGSLTAGLHHVVYTRDAGGQARVYIDGVVEGQSSVGGSLSNWDTAMPLLLGNEASGGRPWLGEYKLVAFYARALSAAEVAQNLLAGSEGDGSSVNIPPVAVAMATPQSGTAPLTVTLDGTSSTDVDGTIVDYAWDLGDGTMLSGQSVQHTYTEPGFYTATLTVTDDDGESATSSASVNAFDPSGASRVLAGLVALYEFSEASGTTVLDTSGLEPALDLTIEDSGAVTWTSGGLQIESPTVISSVGAATKLIDTARTSQEVTVEAWVTSSDLSQNGPARIISVSSTSSSRNVTLGQGVYNKGGDRFEVRLRSTGTSNNGTPATQTPRGSLDTGLHHVVYTRNAAGQTAVYIDGVVEGQATVGGSLSNWDTAMPLLLGNEASGGRPWLGEYKLVAFYGRALDAAEVAQNLAAGPEGQGGTSNAPPVAVVMATPQSGTAPLTVTLDGTSSTDVDGTIVDYAWDLGDGTMLSGQSLQHTYTGPGVYTATLTVTDDDGAVTSDASVVTVVPGTGTTTDWWTSSLSMRLPIAVSATTVPLRDRVASVDVDLLSALGGAALDPDQFRLVEYDASGEVTDPAVPFQFDPAEGFDAVTDPRGTVSILLTGDTPAATERTYHLYFAASAGGTFSPPPVLPLVASPELVTDEGQSSYKIATPSGTWFYQLQGGGFSSLDDPDGNDWISYRTGGGSSGEFRGIPNLVYPEGHFHPGATTSQTTLLSQGPVRTSFTSETTDGWRIVWDVFPTWATATVLDAPNNYWFLYEGTPGGAVEPSSDTVTRSGGVTTLLSQSWTLDLPGPEWVYFTDPAQGRALFVAPHEDDAATDSYRTMNGEMTVFGFGREGLGRRLSGAPRTFSVGLADSASVEDAISSATAPVLVQSGAAESRPNDPTATTAAIAPNITLGGVPLTLSFDGLGSNDPGGSIVSYAWDFGDGSTGSGSTPGHVYSAPGTYEITLTVTDASGATVEDHTSLVVAPSAPPPNAPPTAQGSATPLTGNSPLSVSFDGSASSDDGTIVSYMWDFGDGATASGALATHVYATPATYTATLTVIDDGGLLDTASFTVTVLSGGGGTGGTGGGGTGGTGTGGTGGGGTGGTGGGGPPTGAFLSDDFFDGALDTVLWDVVDPRGDGTVQIVGGGTQDAQLLLSVPAGTSHDLWENNNNALRVTQPVANLDFGVEAKFESEPTQKFQMQGLLIEADQANYLRFDVYHSGSSLKVFCATFVNGSPTVRVSKSIPSAPTTYLRLTRNGDQWTAERSNDGASWTTETTFSFAFSPASVGVFAGNAGPSPAFTAVVDYVFDTGAPIEPEDVPPCAPSDDFTFTATAIGPGTVSLDPSKPTYSCGEVVTLTASPDPGSAFLGWSGALAGTANPAQFAVNTDGSATASFGVDSTPPVIGNVDVSVNGNSATVTWTTDEPTTGAVDYGETISYELGSVPSGTTSLSHSVVLSGLTPGSVYNYQIYAEDGSGNSTTSSNATFAVTAGDAPLIDVWYGDSQSFGSLGNPQRWVNILGQVSDPDGVSSASFSLNGGAFQTLGLGSFRRLAEPNDFNVEIDYSTLPVGSNTIVIRAVDGLGFETTKAVTLQYTGGTVWPLPYVADWSSANEVSDVAQAVDGRWSIVGDALRNDLQRYDRTVAIGDITWTDYEVTVPVTIHGFSAAASGGVNGYPAVGVMLKWPGHSDWTGDQPTWGYYPTGGGGWYEFTNLGPGGLKLTDFEGLKDVDPFNRVLALGTTYIWKIRVETQGDGSSLYRMRVWAQGSPEPLGWELADADSSDVLGGCVLLIAHFTDVSFGNVVVEPL